MMIAKFLSFIVSEIESLERISFCVPIKKEEDRSEINLVLIRWFAKQSCEPGGH